MTKTPKDPVTWSSGCEAAFHSARMDHDPSASDRARVLRGLAERIANEPSEKTGLERAGAEQTTSQTPQGLSVLKLVKVALGATSVIFGAFGLMQALDTRDPQKSTEEPSTLASGLSAASPLPPVVVPDASSTTPAASTPHLPVVSLPRERHRSMTRAKPTARTRHERLHADATRNDPEQSSSAPNLDVRQARAETAQSPHEPSAAPPPNDHAQTRAATRTVDNGTQRTLDQPDSPTLPANNGPSEALFVARINKAVMDKKLRAALALCDEHERRWPQSRFQLEREALRAIASCGSKTNRAEMLARRFLASNATAPLAPNVREACDAQLKPAK